MDEISHEVMVREGDPRAFNFGNHIQVRIFPYEFQEKKILSDGTILEQGDLFGELYFTRNQELLPKGNVDESAALLYRDFLIGMVEISKSIDSGEMGSIKAIHGMTSLRRRRSERLGFEVEDLDSRITKLGIALMAVGHSSENGEPGNFFQKLKAKYNQTHQIWISAANLKVNRDFYEERLKAFNVSGKIP